MILVEANRAHDIYLLWVILFLRSRDMADAKKQDQDTTVKQSYYLPDYGISVVASSSDEAIEIAKSKVKKDEGDK